MEMGDVTATEVDESKGQVEDQPAEIITDDGGAEEWKPNLTYKVLDEERKFDERLATVIKDKATEDYFRDLYTKADGLDSYKQKYAEIEGQSKQLVQGYQTLKQLRDQGNVAGLMEAIGLKEDALFDYVHKKLQEEQLPEEDRKVLERERQLQKENEQYKRKLSEYEQQVLDTAVDADIRELEMMVGSPTVAPISKAMQKQGLSLADEVIKEGHFEYLQTGKEPAVKDVVERVAKRYSYLAANQQTETKKPTLPTVRGGNASAIDKPISSLEELRKLANSGAF
jgi:altronate dehydratase